MKRTIRTTAAATAALTLLAACGGTGGADEGGEFTESGESDPGADHESAFDLFIH